MKVGIDLGTTYSLVARMEPDGTPVLLPDQTDRDVLYTPSVVYIADTCAFVGHVVEALAEENPELKTIRFFKRQLGEGKPIYFDAQQTPWYAESIAALVLKKLAFDAESYTGSSVDGAVITVPAHFNDVQRKAVQAAAQLAELPLLGLLEEPAAAALHYGVASRSSDEVLLVYDLGGGTFDATALVMSPGRATVLAKDGITDLGGKEFDERIGEIVLHQFERSGGMPQLSARTLLQLRRISEELKIELCMPGRSYVRRPVLLAGQAVEVQISRRDFETAIADDVARTEAVTLRCLEGAGLKPEQVEAVLLVGGSSMVPYVGERLKRIFTGVPQGVFFHEPTKAVVYGAALHAAQLTGEAELYQLPPELRGVTGYCVGVRTLDPQTGRIRIDTVIKKNLPLPVRVKKTYYTTRQNQERMVIELVQYRDAQDQVVSIGQLVVGPLPNPQQNYPIEVSIENREDGTVAVQAHDPQTGVELQKVFGRGEDDVFGHLAAQRALVRSTIINNL